MLENLEKRMLTLEIYMCNVQKMLEKITTNDLPHIQDSIVATRERVVEVQGAYKWLKGRQMLIIAGLGILFGAIIGLYVLLIEHGSKI